MRIDKFLKVSRIVKRRTVATELCNNGRVTLNGRTAKPASTVKTGDIIVVSYNQGDVKLKVKEVLEFVKKEETSRMYELQTSESLNYDEVLKETEAKLREELDNE